MLRSVESSSVTKRLFRTTVSSVRNVIKVRKLHVENFCLAMDVGVQPVGGSEFQHTDSFPPWKGGGSLPIELIVPTIDSGLRLSFCWAVGVAREPLT